MERELNDQASKLRQKAWEKDHKARYVTISSGKGGVGKTTFTINFACLLAQKGKKVLVFDADLGLANIDIMLKVPPGKNIRAFLEGKASIDEILVKDIYGFDLLPASSGVAELAEMSDTHFEKIKQLMMSLDNKYEYILFDTGAGIASNVQKFVTLADYVIVISQPEPSAIADAYAFIKTAKTHYKLEKAYLVFNRVDEPAVAQKVYENLRGVVNKFLNIDLALFANLKEDNFIRKAVRSQKPICFMAPHSEFVSGIRAVVAKDEMFE